MVTAREYARLAAKARRNGVINTPDLIAVRPERTAVNAYWKWIEGHYDARVERVLGVISDSWLRENIGQLRVGSLVAPFDGKAIPEHGLLLGAPIEQQPVTWRDCSKWTLHVPRKSRQQDAVGPHKDPCESCHAIELDDAQLGVVAEAFYRAWGADARPESLDPQCFLFGQPPLTSIYAKKSDGPPIGRIVGLCDQRPIVDFVDRAQGSTTVQVNAFLDRVQAIPDVVVISRSAAGKRLDEVLDAVRAAWSEKTTFDEPVTEQAPTNGEAALD
jgi:hypothetical protein